MCGELVVHIRAYITKKVTEPDRKVRMSLITGVRGYSGIFAILNQSGIWKAVQRIHYRCVHVSVCSCAQRLDLEAEPQKLSNRKHNCKWVLKLRCISWDPE